MQNLDYSVPVDEFQRIESKESWSNRLRRLLSISLFCNMKTTSTINENTQVRLGLLIAILAVCLGGMFSAVWWTASWTSKTQSTLNMILVEQKLANAQFQVLQVQVNQLQKDLDLHKVSTATRFQK